MTITIAIWPMVVVSRASQKERKSRIRSGSGRNDIKFAPSGQDFARQAAPGARRNSLPVRLLSMDRRATTHLDCCEEERGMRPILIASALALALVATGCKVSTTPGNDTTATAAQGDWPGFVNGFIEATFKANPGFAVGQGRHEYDGQVGDLSE